MSGAFQKQEKKKVCLILLKNLIEKKSKEGLTNVIISEQTALQNQFLTGSRQSFYALQAEITSALHVK